MSASASTSPTNIDIKVESVDNDTIMKDDGSNLEIAADLENDNNDEEDKPSKKRHRPASLNLQNTTNLLVGNNQSKENLENFALRLVSPGLPALNAKMKTTVMISKTIEIQQKQLIAQRNGSQPSSTNSLTSKNGIFSNDDTDIKSPMFESNGDSGLTGDLDKFQIPSSKRLKRNHIPKQLNINDTDMRFNPLIKSAPIRPNNYFSPLRVQKNLPNLLHKQQQQQQQHFINNNMINQRLFPNHYSQFLQQQQQFPLHYSPNSRINNPNFRTYMTPNTAVPYKRYRNKTPYTNQFQRNQQMNLQLLSPHPSSGAGNRKMSTTVTDVFHGDFSKAAPPQSQPLSAQKEMFNMNSNFDKLKDRIPVSKEEVEEMEIIINENKNKYKSKSHSPSSLAPKSDPIEEGNEDEEDSKDNEEEEEEEEDEDEDEDDDVEGKAIDEEDNIQLSELIMKTQIENQKNKTILGSIHIMNEYFKFEIFKSNNIYNDKNEFLRLCENAWDKSLNSI